MAHALFDKLRSLYSHKWAWLGSGLVLGVLLILGIRFVTYKPADHVHYHANFAVYLNGEHEQFSDPSYYEDVSACQASGNSITPADRAHMHDKINNLVHVHDHGVTWGQFFENLGWFIGDDFIKTRTQMYMSPADHNQLHILLNNQDITGLTPITNTVIRDQDVLLVSFGDIDASTLQQENMHIARTAHQADIGTDPKSCAAGGDTITWQDRFKHLF